MVAQELSEKNKFHLTGKYKGTNGSEIRLNAMNVPRGSVTVTAGGATLIENVDYTVDYTMGTVTILNTSILESGTNVDVKLENQSTFSMQRKSLFGAHLEYEFNKDLVVGGTIMHLRERPLTTKVNTGSEPLANTIWGVNGSWRTEMQWLKRVATGVGYQGLAEGETDLLIGNDGNEILNQQLDQTGLPIVKEIIWMEPLAILLNKENPVKNLTVSQIQDIYFGRISNWNEVGGADLSIHTYQLERGNGSQTAFEKIVRGNNLDEYTALPPVQE